MKRRINGHIRLYALIGSSVEHSGSPAMQNYSFESWNRCNMTGHITDGVGFILNLKEHGVEGQKMVIIGTVFIEDLDNKEKVCRGC